MRAHSSRSTKKQKRAAFHVAKFGRARVPVYRRKTPQGNDAFMVVNYSTGKRRFDCFADASEAIEAAAELAKKLSKRQVVAASMTNEAAAEYASAVQSLAPCNVSLPAAASTLAECLGLVGGLTDLLAAARFYAARHRRTETKPVVEIVTELLAVKAQRGASARYLQDLRFRLGKLSDAFKKAACNVTTAEVQTWLDHASGSPQSYTNFRRVFHGFFEFCVARGYASDNPVAAIERVKVTGSDVAVFTPAELRRLLAASSPDFLPCLAIGAFAGLRSAEIERLEWSDIRLVDRCIVVGADRSKTASRRVVPICDALAQWLGPYAERQGKVWQGGHYFKTQKSTAAATKIEGDAAKGVKFLAPVKWRPNALRHSYASYRFALTGDAGRVAGELGNSAAVVHKHYRELVKPADAERWFALKPDAPANVTPLPAANANA